MGVLKNWRRTTRRGRRGRRPPPEARFTEIGTDYAAAPLTTTPHFRAPNPYVGFDGTPTAAAPSSSARRSRGGTPPWGSPTGAKEPAAQGPAKATAVAVAPPTRAPAAPAPWATGAHTRRARRPRGALVAVVVTAVLLVCGLAVGGAIRLISGGDGAALPDAGDLDVAWQLESDAVSGDWLGFDPVDGTLPGSVLPTPTGWLVMQEASTVDAVLASVDPATGDVQWFTPMPEARCTQVGADARLVCLTRDDPGATFQLVTVDPATGGVIDDPVPTSLTHVPAILLGLGDGVMTLTVTGTLAALDMGGTVLWEAPLDLPHLDTDYLRADVARYDDAVLLYLGSYVGTVHATPEGFTTHHCDDVAATPEAWICVDVDADEAIGHSPEGETLWTGHWDEYYLVDQYERIAPIVLADNWDGSVSGVDPLTGEHGVPIPVGEVSDNLSFVGDVAHPLVTTDTSIALLDPDLTTLLWQTDVTDEYLNIAYGGFVGGTIVIDAQHSYGFDPGTGELLWEHNFVGHDVMLIDGALVTLGSSALTRFDV